MEIKRFARAGDEDNQVTLGNMYYHGKRVKQDYKKAFKWFKKAAEKGNLPAQFILSVMYHKGEGVEKNNKEAFIWASIVYSRGLNGISEMQRSLSYIITTTRFHFTSDEDRKKTLDEAFKRYYDFNDKSWNSFVGKLDNQYF